MHIRRDLKVCSISEMLRIWWRGVCYVYEL